MIISLWLLVEEIYLNYRIWFICEDSYYYFINIVFGKVLKIDNYDNVKIFIFIEDMLRCIILVNTMRREVSFGEKY